MSQKKDIRLGKNKFNILILIFLIYFLTYDNTLPSDNLEGSTTIIKILDKISSKNSEVKLKNTEEIIFKDLSIKSIKCSNSKFDDNPEIKAYVQVKDLTDKKKDLSLIHI